MSETVIKKGRTSANSQTEKEEEEECIIIFL